jgi:hypothetical protein
MPVINISFMVYYGVFLSFVHPPDQTYNMKRDSVDSMSAGLRGDAISKHGS